MVQEFRRSNEILIRQANEEDIPNLLKSFGDKDSPFTKENYLRYISTTDWSKEKSLRLFVLVLGNEIIGQMMAMNITPRYLECDNSIPNLYLSGIRVIVSEMKKGFATEALQFLKQEALNQNIHLVRLECDGKKEWLVNWYIRNGFQIVPYTGDNEDFKATGQVIMECQF
ncbi:hypothetical protein HDV02_002688 [Globomyces sp. JEL0801]|nr:hypothetical protein HDV02_002688 [Globomyces sp. JEL0801]